MSFEVGVLVFGVVIPCLLAALCGRHVRAYLSAGFLISLAMGITFSAIVRERGEDEELYYWIFISITIFGPMLGVYLLWYTVFLAVRSSVDRVSERSRGDHDPRSIASALRVRPAFARAIAAVALGLVIVLLLIPLVL